MSDVDKFLHQAVVNSQGKFIGLLSGKTEADIKEQAMKLKVKRYGHVIGNRVKRNPVGKRKFGG